MTLKEKVSEIVIKKVNLTIDETLLHIAIDEVEETILNYCNLSEVPEGLKYTWANMVEDLVRYQIALNTQSNGSTGTISLGDVSSLKIGDTTINVDASKNTQTKALSTHTSDLDAIVRNYKMHLNKYRRMVW